jgi:methionyl-tRNA formyltransferase
MDVVFLGSGAFGIPTLEQLAREHTITGIVTQPDRPAGRKKVLTPTPIGAWAAEHLPDIPVLKPENINTDGPREEIRAWASGAWVVIAYGQYLGSKLIENRFAINLHASLLPRWRGAAPINAAMVAGDTITGNSVITIAKAMDAGFVLGQSERAIAPDITMGTLHDLLADDGPNLVKEILDDHAQDRVQYTPPR